MWQESQRLDVSKARAQPAHGQDDGAATGGTPASGQNDGSARQASRTGHELSVLARAFYQGGIYGQLNVGGLGTLEVVCRLIAVLVEATVNPVDPTGPRLATWKEP